MILAADIGNSNIVLGLHSGKGWSHIWRLETNPRKYIEEYQQEVESLFAKDEIHVSGIQGVVVGSVVPVMNKVIMSALENVIGKRPRLIDAGVYEKLNLQVLNPDEIGTDLVANAYASYAIYKQSCLIVDFGTALTFTLIDKSGAIKGVSIAPGIKTALKSLSAEAAQLPEVPIELPDKILGTNTVTAIQSGTLWGYTGLIKSMVFEIKENYGGIQKVIATGGLAGILKPLKGVFNVFDPNLTLEGLRLMDKELQGTE